MMKRDDLLEVEEGELCMIGHWSVVKSEELSSRYALSPLRNSFNPMRMCSRNLIADLQREYMTIAYLSKKIKNQEI